MTTIFRRIISKNGVLFAKDEASGGGDSAPSGEILFGTGTGVDSDPGFTKDIVRAGLIPDYAMSLREHFFSIQAVRVPGYDIRTAGSGIFWDGYQLDMTWTTEAGHPGIWRFPIKPPNYDSSYLWLLANPSPISANAILGSPYVLDRTVMPFLGMDAMSWSQTWVLRVPVSTLIDVAFGLDDSTKLWSVGSTGPDFGNATLDVGAAEDNTAIRFMSPNFGPGFNLVTVALVNPGGTVASTTAAAVGLAITVTLATSSGSIVATASDVINAILTDPICGALIAQTQTNGGNGSGVVSAMGATHLARGRYGDNAYGFAVSEGSGGSTTWKAVVQKDETKTALDTGVTVDTNFHKFKVANDGTTTRFYIDDVLVASTTSANRSPNGVMPYMACSGLDPTDDPDPEISERKVDIDFFGMTIEL